MISFFAVVIAEVIPLVAIPSVVTCKKGSFSFTFAEITFPVTEIPSPAVYTSIRPVTSRSVTTGSRSESVFHVNLKYVPVLPSGFSTNSTLVSIPSLTKSETSIASPT